VNITEPGGYATTAVTRQVIALAGSVGLHPSLDLSGIRHGAYRVTVNAPGRDGLFGSISIGARTGRILHAHLTHGNWGEEKRYGTVAEVRAIIKSWAAVQRVA